jgi:uncharacterized protein YbjQ (UPF0145 family)
MIVVTTPFIAGYSIVEYKGIVVGEAIIGTNIFRDIMASLTDVVGGRSNAYEKVIESARNAAYKQLIDRTKKVGGNGIIGVDIDYESINEMMMVCYSGTAVTLKKNDKKENLNQMGFYSFKKMP